jgi:hypothetical protein
MIDGGLNHLRQLSERQKADYMVRKQRRLFAKLPLYLTKGNKQKTASYTSTEAERKHSRALLKGPTIQHDLRILLAFILALGITLLGVFAIVSWLT